MPSITPTLWFDHDLEEAASFYTSVFPNSHIEGLTGPPMPDPASRARSCRAASCWTEPDEVDHYWDR